jgi:two-component system, NarL family, invasion response regulator UvrY
VAGEQAMQVNRKTEPTGPQDAADVATLRRPLRVLIVDDHPIIASACRAMFAGDSDVTIIEASDAESGETVFTMERPDVCVLDINLPGVTGFELARRILAKSPHERIIIFSMNDDPVFAKRAIEAGARGYVSKSGDPADLARAIRDVAGGGVFLPSSLAQEIAFGGLNVAGDRLAKLTAREIEILRLLAAGKSLSEIAWSIKVSYKTIANTSSIIRRKLGLRTAAEMVRIAIEEGLG